jgi:hypothetical protein
MNSINIETYEAFYLDYLEGKLSKQDCIAMDLFLSAHPELKVDDDLPSFNISDFTITYPDKNLLKAFDYQTDINSGNIDSFLIAELEGQLGSLKKRDLSDFLKKNPEFKKDQTLYQKTILESPLHLVYPNKAELKHKSTLSLWPVITIAAATICCVLLFQFFSNPVTTVALAVKSNSFLPKIKHLKTMLAAQNPSPVFNKSRNVSGEIRSTKQSPTNTLDPLKIVTMPLLSLEEKSLLEKTQVVPLSKSIPTVPKENHSNEYAMAMKNQMKPAVRILSEVIKQEVIYQKGIDENNNRKGFYLKIGKLEISTNRKLDSSEN